MMGGKRYDQIHSKGSSITIGKNLDETSAISVNGNHQGEELYLDLLEMSTLQNMR